MIKNETKIKYGLWHKRKKCLLCYRLESNEGRDFCCQNTHHLEIPFDKEEPWLVNNDYNAEYVRNFSTMWYNAGYDTPNHKFKPDELIVVKIKISQEIESIDVKIPTMKEYFDEKYKEKEPQHWKYWTDLLDQGKENLCNYTFYELEELLLERKRQK
jgi:hypothetical protein